MDFIGATFHFVVTFQPLMTRKISVWFAILLTASGLFAQTVTTCTVPVTLLDREFNFVSDVSAEDLRVTYGSTSVRIISMERSTPSHVVLLLDSSKPMKEGYPNPRPQQLDLTYFLASAAPNEVALVVFTDEIQAVMEGREKVKQEIMARESGKDETKGKSEMITALNRTAESMNAKPGDVIFAVGLDGNARSRKEEREQLRGTLLRRGIRFFYLESKFPRGPFGMSHSSGNIIREFETEARDSGGYSNIWPVHPSMNEWMGILKDSYVNSMYRFYKVEIEEPKPWIPNQAFEIEYVNKSSPKHGVRLLYPKEPVCALRQEPPK